MKTPITTKNLARIALMTALVFSATFLIKIPTPTGGYVHPGDTFVLLSAFVLNPWAAAVSSGLGAALADLVGGYLTYVPATFIIKASGAICMAYFAPKIVSTDTKRFKLTYFPAAILTNVLMLSGYFIYELFLYDFSVAVLGIPGNLSQAACAIVMAYLISFSLQTLFKN